MHAIRLTMLSTMAGDPTHAVEVRCPDDLEVTLREYLTPPLHLVAWGVMEAAAADPAWAAACDMEGIHDLPLDTVRVSEMGFLVAGRVRVELLGGVG